MGNISTLPSTKERGRFYRPELDIVRLLAFLAVFSTHSSRPSGDAFYTYRIIADAGNFGLSLFFVLSAFLISTLLLREKDIAKTVSIQNFYRRRILRIWPLYFLALAFAAFWSFRLGHLGTEKWWFLAALVMGGNIVQWPGNLAGHLWSISVEEQFYVVWPSAVRFLNRRNLARLALLIVIGANAALIYYGIKGIPQEQAWGNTLVQFESFAAGTLLALLVESPRTWPSTFWLRIPLALAVPFIWYAVVRYLRIKEDGIRTVGPASLCLGYVLVSASSCLLIYALLGSTRWPRLAVYLGKISYGLYVLHIPALYFVNNCLHQVSPFLRRPLALLLTVILATISYRFFESPFLRLKQRFEIVPSRPVESESVPKTKSIATPD